MTTLENSYCVPRTVEEWGMLYPNANWQGLYPSKQSHVSWKDGGMYLASWPNDDLTKKEIPVPHFLDLLHNRIVPWRVLEAGFDNGLPRLLKISGSVDNHVIAYSSAGIWVNGARYDNITTFTDLLKLISFLKPESND